MGISAIVEAFGRQYHVEPNIDIEVDKVDLPEGETFEVQNVLLLKADGKTWVGTPYVEGAKVVMQVLSHYRGRKIIVFKYRPKKRYRRKHGHRQWLTKVKVIDIVIPHEREVSDDGA